ncbi:MAG: flagellin [Acidobacteriaceae bacterium]
MPLGVLNNISAIYAENNLNQTQSSLQNTLTQLSSGSRINSGADDPAGLAIADGLAANSAALTQSSSNASEGVGFLQVADGALSQVTNLLNSAVTLATEAGGGTLSSSQMSAANQEYQDILTQIGTIGATTEYNGIQVFSSDQSMSALSWAQGTGTAASSATGAASQIQSSAITAGGSTAGTAPTLTQTYGSTYGSAASLSWTSGGSGSTSTLTSGAITAGAELTGDLKFTPTMSSGTPTAIDIDLSTLTGSTPTALASSLATALNGATGYGANDFTVTVNSNNDLVIGLGTGASAANITGLGSASSSTSEQASLLGNGFTLAVTDGDWQNGSISLTGSGSGASNVPSSISLAGVNTADLASVVGTALNGTSSNPDYSVTYNVNSTTHVGTLAVSLTSQAATDNITGLTAMAGTGNSAPAQSLAANSAITFTNGDTLGGEFTITPTVNGTASSSPVTVNLTGVTTANLVATVNAALGNNASDYSVAYSSTTGKLTIGVSTAGQAAGYDAVTLANGSGSNALSQSQSVVSTIADTSSVTGGFTLTPTLSSGTPAATDVNLSGSAVYDSTSQSSPLATAVQTALGSDYAVSYNNTTGQLGVAVTAAGAAAGITGFTLAESSQASASQLTAVDGGVEIYTSDGTSTGSENYNVTVGTLSDASVGTSSSSSSLGAQVTVTVGGVTGTGGTAAGGTVGTSLANTTLLSQADAEAALQTVDNAISAVAYQRGQVGANINTLNAASNIASSQETNVTSAQNTITATDYASATSNLSKYEILTQTGISALAQANSTQQMVTKLLQ